jgi:hypothetical protein
MNAMGHDVPNVLGVKQAGDEAKIRRILPRYMAMGEAGMGNMMDMGRPKNTLPMMDGEGPFGPVEMGGMFTVLKVRERLTSYADPGGYGHPRHHRPQGRGPQVAPPDAAQPGGPSTRRNARGGSDPGSRSRRCSPSTHSTSAASSWVSRRSSSR